MASIQTRSSTSNLRLTATKAKQPCFSCDSPDHLAHHCPLKPSVTAPGLHCPICNHLCHTARDCSLLSHEHTSHMTTQPHASQATTNDDNICRVYNKRAFCFRGAKCPYLHICSACRGGHPRRAYPNQAQYQYPIRLHTLTTADICAISCLSS